MTSLDDNSATAFDNKILAEDALGIDPLLNGEIAAAEPHELFSCERKREPQAQEKSRFEPNGATKKDLIFWVRNRRAGGALGNQGLGTYSKNIPPQIKTGTTNGVSWACVKIGTGIIVVERSYTAVQAGDQGVGEGKSSFPNQRVHISDRLANDLDAHEQGHIIASKKVFELTLRNTIKIVETYTQVPLIGQNGESESQVKARLNNLISWEQSLSYFVDQDIDVNKGLKEKQPPEKDGRFHKWETSQGGGPLALEKDRNPETINGIKYDVALKSRAETETNYRLPNYSDYNPEFF